MSLTTAQQAVLNVHMALLGNAPRNAEFVANMAVANRNIADWATMVNNHVNTNFAGADGTARLAAAVITNLGLGAVPNIQAEALAFFNSRPAARGVLAFEATQWLLNTSFRADQPELRDAQAAFRAAQAAAFNHSDNPASVAPASSVPVSTFTLTSSAPTVAEGADGDLPNLTFTLTLDRAPAQPVTVNWSTLGTGTATADVDFAAQTGTVTFAAGQRSASVNVQVIGDNAFEPNETVRVEFSGARLVAPVVATGTISNDDVQLFTLTSSAPAVAEGADGTTRDLIFVVRLNAAPAEAITVNFATLTTGTATEGDDFVPVGGTVTFAAGQTLAVVRVPVLGDNAFEADETVRVEFTGARLVAPVVAEGTIRNDDAALFTLTASAPSVAEGAAGTTSNLSFTLTLDRAPTEAVTVNVQTLAGGSATSGTDFTPLTSTVTFAAGQSTATVDVQVIGDNAHESNETVVVQFSGARLVAPVVATGVITNDDDQTFVLTTAADSGAAFTGGTRDDTFVGVIGAGVGTVTLNAGDMLTGGEGNDTLSVSISGTGVTTTAAMVLAGIETIAVSNFETGNNVNTLNLAQSSGVQNVKVTASSATGDTAFTSVGSIVTAEMASGAGDLTITYANAAVAGTADVQSLALQGQTGGAFTVAGATTGGVETLNISSTVAANTIAINDALAPTITTMNITGDQNLTLTEGGTSPNNAVTRINAADFTGILDVTAGSAALSMSVTGGSGNDIVRLGNFDATDSVDGGTGNDTLVVTGVSTTQATYANVTNVETINVVSAHNVTLNANISATTIDVAAGANVANTVQFDTGYTNATTVVIDAADTVTNNANIALTVNATDAAVAGATAITGGTGNDTLNITAASEGGTAITLSGTVAGVEFINIVDGGDTTATRGSDIRITTGNYATNLTIDATALDAGTVTNNVMGNNDETLTVNGSGIVGATVVLNVRGGEGRDTITGGAGNDILIGNGGNDSINGASGGNDSINGGAGDDTINMGAQLTAGDTIDGGEGNDTLAVTSLSASGLTNVTNVENLALSGNGSTANLTANLSFTSIDMASVDNFGQVLTLGAGYTNATTVSIDAGDRVVNSANVAMTVNATAADLQSGDLTTITGGTGNDTLNITADGSTVAFANLITLVDRVVVVDSGDTVATRGSDINLALGNYATSLTVDASALDAGTVVNNVMGAEDETLTVDGSGLGAAVVLTAIGGEGRDTITGGAGNDILVGNGGNDSINGASGGFDSISAGAGDDTINMTGSALSYQDTVAGGEGNDTLLVANGEADVNFMNVSGVETLTVTAAGTTTLGNFAQAAGIRTVNVTDGASNVVNAAATTVGLTIVGSTSNGNDDSLVGGTGNDTFSFSGMTGLQGSGANVDTITGGTGTDTVLLDNSNGAVTAEADLFAVTGVENFTVANANGGDAAGALNADAISLTFQGADNGTNNPDVVINASAAVITDANDGAVINAAAVSDTDFFFSITGGAGNDELSGGAVADTISGGDGVDTITGNGGADVLTGGSGNDFFDYLTLGASTNAAADTITDFATGNDVIRITVTAGAGTTFDGTYKGTAADNAAALSLLSGSAGTTTSRVGQYFFNTTTKQLVVDADGNGLIQSGDMAVTLTGMSAMGAADVAFIVTDSTGAETITTGGGADTINLTDTTANKGDVVNAGAGNDTINAIQSRLNDTTSDTIIGGDGNDTLRITGTGTVANFGSDAALAGVENIVLGTNSMVIDLSNQTEVFNITTANGTNSVNVDGDVAHTITGGTGVDTFIMSREQLAAIGSITGGDGTDVISVNSVGFTIAGAASFARIAAVETLSAGTATANAISITLNADAFTAGIRTVTLAADTTAGGNNTINASNAITGQDLTLTGSAGVDSITGGAGADVITGGEGADVITGGAAIDTITLTETTSVQDTVVSAITTVTDSDLITGFVSGTDKFQYTGALTLTGGVTAVSNATLAGGVGADATAEVFIVTTNIADGVSNTQGTAFAALLAANAAGAAAAYGTLETQLVAANGVFGAVIAGLDTAIGNTEQALIVLDNGTGSIVLRYVADTTSANQITAAELELVGVFTNTAQMAVADFI